MGSHARAALGRLVVRLRGQAATSPRLPPTLERSWEELARNGSAPLVRRPRSTTALSVAVVLPSFRSGSGGHQTAVRLSEELLARGHRVSLWLEDSEGWHRRTGTSAIQAQFREAFHSTLPLAVGFKSWSGADIALATGWQTVPRVLLLPGLGARAYLVQDHEPEFYPTSWPSYLAQSSYRLGLFCIAASSWLAALLQDRYGAPATHFDLPVDHSLYRPPSAQGEGQAGSPQTVLFYARAATPRRAVPLGLRALELFHCAKPQVRLVLFGEGGRLPLEAPHENLGVQPPSALAAIYRSASAGLSLSLTNPSLVTLEMMACGLPCVELRTEANLAAYGQAGAPLLAPPEPSAVARCLQSLLEESALAERVRNAGLRYTAKRRWDRAAAQVEDALFALLHDGPSTA